ncbi:MAG: internal scaffolding protein [Microvirus sp.]|nr:MAG: internal scaffolding protein [Microvirus sp.]
MTQTLRHFYRPHPRVTQDNLSLDPATGELVYLPSMTKQEFKHECDINNVIKSFSQTGMFRHVSARASQGAYEDLPDGVDFQYALDEVQRARNSFMTLPAHVRQRFGHDPGQFLGFIHDPSNKDEMAKLGLLVPTPPPPSPIPVILAPGSQTGGDGGIPPVAGAKAP